MLTVDKGNRPQTRIIKSAAGIVHRLWRSKNPGRAAPGGWQTDTRSVPAVIYRKASGTAAFFRAT